jgi:diguanylate cyclase (GGDEF)-like protein
MTNLDSQISAAIADRHDSLVWSTDSELVVASCRGGALRTSGIDVGELVSRTGAAHQTALAGAVVDLDYDVADRVYELHIAPARGVTGEITGCVGIARDATALRRAERTMAWQAAHDPLTGLANRTALRETVASEIRSARRAAGSFALILLDVDEMHRINDGVGQDAGDDILVSIAGRIVAAAGPRAVVARVGGDAFAVLAREWPVRVVVAIIEAMQAPFRVGDEDASISVSAGIAEFPHHGTSPDQLLCAAEAALRRAIEAGGSQYQVASADVTFAASERLGAEVQVRQAIERGELCLLYQPQVRLEDGELLGLEALVRWRRGDELIPASAFIRAVEESPVIVDLGEWVLDEACRQLREWSDAGCAPPRIALNIGARHFQHPAFLPVVRRSIERHGIDSRMLEIEITETTAMHKADTSMRLIDELRELGLEITIDDFGTGYSSLAYLKRFAITGVKIDRSFVLDLPMSRSATAIVRAILATAQALGLRVVAEGVEQAEQAGFLSAAGCDEAQGYWFGRPMPAGEIEVYMRKRGHPRPVADR